MRFLKTNATGRRAWTNKVISLKINFKISTNPLDDLSNYRSRVGEKLWYRWDPYWLPPFGDLLCSLPASDGDPYNSRWWIVRKTIPYRFIHRIMKMSISIVDLDMVLYHFSVTLWRISGVLTFSSFLSLRVFSLVEHVEDIDVLTVFEVVAVWCELDVYVDGVIISFLLS
jgi:hypothetical protein